MSGVARPESSTSRIIALMFLLIACGIAYMVAPLFLPMWRWQNVDFKKIAKDSGLPESQITKQFDVVFRYAPRSNDEDDPFPFQIVTMRPTWLEADEKNHADEDHVLVRCRAVNDRTGGPPSKLLIGNTYKDRYFHAKAWRLPPGTFGMGKTRPILLYVGMSLEKVSLGDSSMTDSEINRGGNWQNDDEWDGRDDGWDAAAWEQEKAEKAAAESAKARNGDGDGDKPAGQ